MPCDVFSRLRGKCRRADEARASVVAPSHRPAPDTPRSRRSAPPFRSRGRNLAPIALNSAHDRRFLLPDARFPGHDKLVVRARRRRRQRRRARHHRRAAQHPVRADPRSATCTCPTACSNPSRTTTRAARSTAARRLGYSVVAMTWGPGQGTPIHDHCGLWCVEGVWDGQLEITQYELLERDGERFRFRAAGGMQAGPGSAGSLIPPHEYHTIRNAERRRGRRVAAHLQGADGVLLEVPAAGGRMVPAHGQRTGDRRSSVKASGSGPASAILRARAEVAESVDAADSKSAALKSVWVRVPPSAPAKTRA